MGTGNHDSALLPRDPSGEFVLYRDEAGAAQVQVRLADNTVWLTQRQMAEIYQRSVKTVSEHIQNVYEERELEPEATIRRFRIVQTEGERRVERTVEHYNLDMILAVGYRVRSARGTQFRQWATALLREYVVKGFVLDDERLKDLRNLGRDYFQELLERIRDIRASERRFYQKITDIYATAADYDRGGAETREFFATVQNKMHWAIHGRTAAQLIAQRADASHPTMGLTTWEGGPAGRIHRADVSVAKNYLTEDELRALNRIVTQYLDYAEDMAERRRPMTMADWRDRLDAFLRFNEREVLADAGRVSAEVAKRLAEERFDAFDERRRALEASEPTSDFDRFVQRAKELGEGEDAPRGGD